MATEENKSDRGSGTGKRLPGNASRAQSGQRPGRGRFQAGDQRGSPRGAYRAASCEEPSGVLFVPEQQCRSGFHPRFQIPEGQSDPVSVLKVPVLSVGKIVTSLGKLVSNPKSEEGWETYNKYVVNTAELEQVKYDKVEIPRAELQELGIDFDALPQRTQRSLMLGLPDQRAVSCDGPAFDHGTTTGLFNRSFYRDHNDELKFRLDTPLVQPEYEREEYASEITPDDKALLARGKTLQHLVTVHNSITGKLSAATWPSTLRRTALWPFRTAMSRSRSSPRDVASTMGTKIPQRRLDPAGRMHGLRRYGEHLQGHPELRRLSGPLYDQRSGLRQAVRPEVPS